MKDRLDFSAMLTNGSVCAFSTLPCFFFFFFSVRPVDQWRRQLKVIFYFRCCVMGLGVVVRTRTIRLTMTVVVKSRIIHYSLDPMFLTNNHLQKVLEKLWKLRKSCNHKWNINGIYKKKLLDNCLQQLPTLILKT